MDSPPESPDKTQPSGHFDFGLVTPTTKNPGEFTWPSDQQNCDNKWGLF